MLKELLKDYSGSNVIYYCSDEEYKSIPELLKKDYGYLDILLDFNDIYMINPLLSKLDDDNKDYLYKDYLNYNILHKLNLPIADFDIEEYGKLLKSDNAHEYLNSDYVVDFNVDIIPILKRCALIKNGNARIHYMLDEATDDLMLHINDLFINPNHITMIGYTTKDYVLNRTSTGAMLKERRDYVVYNEKEKKRGVL